MKGEIASEPGALKHAFADGAGHHRHLHLLEDVLVAAVDEGVLAPSGDEATAAGEVFVRIRQANWTDVRTANKVTYYIKRDFFADFWLFF